MSKNPCICINIRRMAQKVTERYDRALRPAGVSLNQYSLLANIAKIEGCGIGELAQRIRLEKSTLVRTLQPLLRDRLIADKSQAGSRRRQLHLTPAGRKTLEKARPLWAKTQKAVAADLGKSLGELEDLFELAESWE